MNLNEIKTYLYDDFDEISFPRSTLLMFDEKISDLKDDLNSIERLLEYTSYDYEYKLVIGMKKIVEDIECLLSD